MSIIKEFINAIDFISEKISIPLIKTVYFPRNEIKIPHGPRKSNFGAMQLEDGSIGIIYINLSNNVRKKGAIIDPIEFKGTDPTVIAQKFASSDEFERTVGLGAINAISQHLFKKSNFSFDLTTDSLGLLDLNTEDVVGMVGFFPPLVRVIEQLNIPLKVIELDPTLVRQTENWEVTLDSNELRKCNKVLITSTTVLNNTIEDILDKCSKAEKISMIGPTAGFIPDPLFKRGVDVLGSTYIHDSNLFMKLISQDKRWGPSTKKYCIQKDNYQGFLSLLEDIE